MYRKQEIVLVDSLGKQHKPFKMEQAIEPQPRDIKTEKKKKEKKKIW